jgi:hypothetical protein
MRSAEQKQSTTLFASTGGDARLDGGRTEATGLGWSDEVGENAPGCGGVPHGSENRVVAMALWPLLGGAARCSARWGGQKVK